MEVIHAFKLEGFWRFISDFTGIYVVRNGKYSYCAGAFG
jgi:hypothetical protein